MSDPAPTKKKCRHENGWFTDTAMVWLNTEAGKREDFVSIYSGIRMNHRGRVRVRCNVNGCEAVRNVYFAKDGAFLNYGRPFIPKAGSR